MIVTQVVEYSHSGIGTGVEGMLPSGSLPPWGSEGVTLILHERYMNGRSYLNYEN